MHEQQACGGGARAVHSCRRQAARACQGQSETLVQRPARLRPPLAPRSRLRRPRQLQQPKRLLRRRPVDGSEWRKLRRRMRSRHRPLQQQQRARQPRLPLQTQPRWRQRRTRTSEQLSKMGTWTGITSTVAACAASSSCRRLRSVSVQGVLPACQVRGPGWRARGNRRGRALCLLKLACPGIICCFSAARLPLRRSVLCSAFSCGVARDWPSTALTPAAFHSPSGL